MTYSWSRCTAWTCRSVCNVQRDCAGSCKAYIRVRVYIYLGLVPTFCEGNNDNLQLQLTAFCLLRAGKKLKQTSLNMGNKYLRDSATV